MSGVCAIISFKSVICASTIGLSLALPQVAAAQSIEFGKTLFTQNCASCHGAEGEGGLGNVLQPNDYIQESSDEMIGQLISEGRPGTAMASFRDRLSEDEIGDIVAFLKSWQP